MSPVEHIKRFHRKFIYTKKSPLYVEGPVLPEQLANYDFHEGLSAFRPAPQQKQALISIAELPEGRIIIAREDNLVVGYVTFLYPDPLERWSQGHMEDLLELGAIEVCSAYRGLGLAKSLLEVSFLDESMEDYIVISTEYYWHWDLEGTGLSVWDYKEVMKKVMGSVGMEYYATDDPEITCHPANMLMARIGKNVPQSSIEKFHDLRFMNRHLF
ncbi:acetoin utilization protein AcuA [Collibacillus ludicampi]|uniref:Acetoin utilization protein AcuA n=1 Tax=Collibacillus ludicampi TaxID=2771369 RepID=A0AAV4L9M4_9BACL|nr:GNAT family N-acetyltransferase [Collibacillus ludicampi]GIM44476.1 acetoin utilization protein AcuA [Collibacillus ludicampi]